MLSGRFGSVWLSLSLFRPCKQIYELWWLGKEDWGRVVRNPQRAVGSLSPDTMECIDHAKWRLRTVNCPLERLTGKKMIASDASSSAPNVQNKQRLVNTLCDT